MIDGETFLGGFAGGFLSKGLRHARYGLYFTTRRVIGISLGNGAGVLAGTLAGLIKGQLMPQLSPEESDKMIMNLEQMKDFDIEKNQISQLLVKKPSLTGSGRFVICPNQGEPVKITLKNTIAYDRLVQLTQAFSPGILTA